MRPSVNLSNSIFTTIASLAVLSRTFPLDFTPTMGNSSHDQITARTLHGRTSYFRPQYRLVRAVQLAMIVPSPLRSTVLASHLYGSAGEGARIYRTMVELYTRHWDRYQGKMWQQAHIGALYIYMRALSLDNPQPIPLDFIQRFGETMELWAVNGFMSLYDIIVENVDTLQEIRVVTSMMPRE